MSTTSITFHSNPLLDLTLSLADDMLILGHRLSEWSSKAPTLEEDIALSNIALDLIGQARTLYDYACKLEPSQKLTEDDFAYLRNQEQYKNCLLVEQENGDFAKTITRQLFYSTFIDIFWQEMLTSSDPTLAAIAAKAEKETAYHFRHAAEWLIRLGDGTPESHKRAQAALNELYAYTGELFLAPPEWAALTANGTIPALASLEAAWRARLAPVIAQSTLTMPEGRFMHKGGRQGKHSEHLGVLLTDLQYLQRSFPNAKW